jgi:hypothetical protein
MTAPFERRVCIAGLEILLRSDERVLGELIAPWQGFAATGRAPDLVHEYGADDGYAGKVPDDRPYPSYGARAESNEHYRFWRADSGGEILAPADGPVTGRFRGKAFGPILEATLRLAVATTLARRGGVLLHGAGAILAEPAGSAPGGSAVVFTGPSGAGKSTISRLLSSSGAAARILGDEMLALRPDPESPTGVRVYATPFGGELGPFPDGDAPLAGIYFLEQAPHHLAIQVGRGAALPKLLRNVLAYVDDRETADLVLGAAAGLLGSVPAYRLQFARDEGVIGAIAPSRIP